MFLHNSKPESTKALSELVFWPARILALLIVATSPWYYGSVSWYCQSLYLPIVLIVFSLAMVGAVLRMERFDNPLVWSLSGLLALAMLQTVTLPEWVWQSVSAGAVFENETDLAVRQLTVPVADALNEIDIEPLVDPAATPRTLSINWVQTRASAVTLAMALAWFIATIILFRTAKWEITLIAVLFATGFAVAILGLIQSVAWNDWTLLPMPHAKNFATFVSRNSGPQYLAVGLGSALGLLVWWTQLKKSSCDASYGVRYRAVNLIASVRRRLDDLVTDLDPFAVICIIAITFFFVATLAATSRGGIIACMVSALVTLGVIIGSNRNVHGLLVLIVAVGCGTLILLVTLGIDDAIFVRMDTINEEVHTLDSDRLELWQRVLIEPKYWLPGCGMGNFHLVTLSANRGGAFGWYYHAESIYVELLAEFGLLGFFIGISGVAWLLTWIRWCVLQLRPAAPSLIGTVFALTSIGLQSFVDFSLIIPGIFLPFIALVGCFLGRSSMIDFGGKPHSNRVTTQALGSSSVASSFLPNAKSALVISAVCAIALIASATAIGIGSLNGFVFAERIASEVNAQQKIAKMRDDVALAASEQILRGINPKTVEVYSFHPEVNIQVGRALQVYVERSLALSTAWPADLTVDHRRALSQPETIAATFRADEKSEYALVRRVAEQSPQSLDTLKSSMNYFIAAVQVCPFDWRPSWGLLRSDLDSLDTGSRIRNYARLSLVSNHSTSLPIQIPAAALLAGEKPIAMSLLQRYLAIVPQRTKEVVTPLLDYITPMELIQLSSSSQLVIADVAEVLSHSPAREAYAQQLLSVIDVQAVSDEVHGDNIKPTDFRPWMVLAWLAERTSNSELHLDALENAVAAAPMSDNIRFEFAKLLSKAGHTERAIQQTERVLRLSPQNAVYKEFLNNLKEQKQD